MGSLGHSFDIDDPLREDDATRERLKEVPVLIEFSVPDQVMNNIQTGLALKKQMVVGTTDGRIFQSIDGGDHWAPVAEPPFDDVGVITYNPYDSAGEIWAAAECGSGSNGLVKSLDSTYTGWAAGVQEFLLVGWCRYGDPTQGIIDLNT